jgi:predicted nucleic acid-binding protein
VTVVYVDSSALLKRVIVEAESSALRTLLRESDGAGDLLTASSLAWLEVWRSLRRAAVSDVATSVAAALSGVAEYALDDATLLAARRIGGNALRSLDAIHLASAVAVGADSLVTYDDRLADAAAGLGLAVLAPGS